MLFFCATNQPERWAWYLRDSFWRAVRGSGQTFSARSKRLENAGCTYAYILIHPRLVSVNQRSLHVHQAELRSLEVASRRYQGIEPRLPGVNRIKVFCSECVAIRLYEERNGSPSSIADPSMGKWMIFLRITKTLFGADDSRPIRDEIGTNCSDPLSTREVSPIGRGCGCRSLHEYACHRHEIVALSVLPWPSLPPPGDP